LWARLMQQSADRDVFKRAERHERFGDLECASQAAPGAHMWDQFIDGFAHQQNRAFRQTQLPRQEIKQSAFSGAVRSDDCEYLASVYVKIDLIDGNQAGKMFADRLGFQQMRAHSSRRRRFRRSRPLTNAPTMPLFIKRAARIITTPIAIEAMPGGYSLNAPRRKISSGMIKAAPTTGPISVPAPPMSARSANLTPVSASENTVGGSITRTSMQNNPPPTPVNAADKAMVMHFTLTTSIPTAAAASSSSRTATM